MVPTQPATKLISDLRAWASQLASENRDMVSVVGYYVPPQAFGEIRRQLEAGCALSIFSSRRRIALLFREDSFLVVVEGFQLQV
jgi:hypothetical protein